MIAACRCSFIAAEVPAQSTIVGAANAHEIVQFDVLRGGVAGYTFGCDNTVAYSPYSPGPK